MPDFTGLKAVPVYGGYLERKKQIADEQLQGVQQASILQKLAQQMEEKKREDEYRMAVGALGDNPDQASLVRLASKYGSPSEVLKTHQASLDRQAANDTRLEAGRESAEARRVAAMEAASLRQQQLDLMRDRVDQSRADSEQRRRFDQWYKTESLKIQQQLADIRGETGRPVTPVTIQDPNDPSATLVIDGRTRQVLGRGPKMTETGKMEAKRQFNMQGIGETIQMAEDILNGVRRQDGVVVPADRPTGSGAGTLYDAAAGFFGASPAGAKEAQQLKALGGALTTKMPRMEGPQSDKDTQLYREMAAAVGDSTLPIEQRKAALNVVKQLWVKYERLNPDAFAGGQPGAPSNPDMPPQVNTPSNRPGIPPQRPKRLRFDAQGNQVQ